jgi:hypothetical protein
MKPVRLGDLRELLQGAAFSAWWTEHGRIVEALREARAHHDDLVSRAEMMRARSEVAQRAAADAFSTAGEAEEDGARLAAEGQELENRAIELVGHYEERRLRTSSLWVRLGGAERALEERREAAARARERKDGAKALAQAEAAVAEAERHGRELREQYALESERGARMWEEVQAAWRASLERSLLASETGARSRRVRREAERLFREAEERRVRAKQLAADADAAGRALGEAEERRAALLAGAGERFGCVAGEDFLFWRDQEDERMAFAVALADDPDGANVPVKALGIYRVGRERGVAFLEPARDGRPPGGGEGGA